MMRRSFHDPCSVRWPVCGERSRDRAGRHAGGPEGASHRR